MIPYEGTEKYIFVSYAHKDSQTVIPIIEVLVAAGFRVWYDSGIEAGSEWPAYIEEHIDGCDKLLAFISPASVESNNCRNEINYATLIKKDILAVYLEETKLAHGMGMQLSATQSMFRYRHSSMTSFLDELTKARILQSCRINSEVTDEDELPMQVVNAAMDELTLDLDIAFAQNSGNRKMIKESRQNGESIISKVGTKGSSDPDDAWPLGQYSQTINIDKHRVIFFHCELVKKITESGEKTVGLQVFDSDDGLVFESITSMQFNKGYDLFSKGWIVRDENELKQASGIYTALLWIDQSRAFEYKFRLTSPSTDIPGTEPSIPTPQNTDKQKEIDELTHKLYYPKLFLFSLLPILSLLVGVITSNAYDKPILAAVTFMITIAFSVILLIKTQKHLIPSWWLSALVSFTCCTYYSLFLGIMSLVVLAKKKEYRQRLNELNGTDNSKQT